MYKCVWREVPIRCERLRILQGWRRVRLQTVVSFTVSVSIWWLRSPQATANRGSAVPAMGGAPVGYTSDSRFGVAFGIQRFRSVLTVGLSGGCALRILGNPCTAVVRVRRGVLGLPASLADGLCRARVASRSASRSCSDGAFTASGGCALRAMIRLRISSRRTGKVAGARILLRPAQASRSASKVLLCVQILQSGGCALRRQLMQRVWGQQRRMARGAPCTVEDIILRGFRASRSASFGRQSRQMPKSEQPKRRRAGPSHEINA